MNREQIGGSARATGVHDQRSERSLLRVVWTVGAGRLRAFGTLEEISRQLSPQRPMEVLLTDAGQVSAAAEVIHKFVEAGDEITPSPAEATVRFRTARREGELAGLLTALVEGGIGVAQFREVASDLEEAFLTVARGEASGNARPVRSGRDA